MTHILKVIQEHLWVPLFLFAESVGVCVIPLGLPGLWIQFVAALLASVLTAQMGLAQLPWFCTGVVFLLALGGEIVDFLLGNRGIKRASGSALAAWFSLAGGFLFGLFGAFAPIPIPVIGSLIGSVLLSFLGTFTFAILGEWIHRKRLEARQPSDEKGKHLKPALRVGTGAVIGRALGVAVKMWFGFLAFGVVVAGLFWDVFVKGG